MTGRGLHLVASAELPIPGAPPEPLVYQASCIEAYQASTARGFSPLTIGQFRIGPRRERLAHPQVQFVLGQHAPHERGLESVDHLLAVGV